MALRKKDPKTKEQLLDRMLSFDFDGDIRHLGEENATLVRTGANSLLLTFPASGVTFELSVHRPREFARAAEGRSFARDRDEEPSTEGLRQTQEPPADPAPKRRRRRQPEEGEQRTGSGRGH